MDRDIDLFSTSQVRRSAFEPGHADTSRLAAVNANATERPTVLVQAALAFVRSAGETGATLDEWLATTGLPQSHSGRFTSLKREGLIVDSGRRRPTRAGRMATVWVVVEART
jgi:hypothetical protein